jgi:hypothetical protein
MEETPQPSKWERTTTRRFLRWLFSARTMRLGLITLAWFVSLVALCDGVIDWRGRHAWNEYRQNYEAHVAPLDLQAFIPKPIPDSENFAATPFANAWVTHYKDTNVLYVRDAWFHAADMIASPPELPSRHKYEEHFENLVAWQEAFAAVRAHSGKHKDEFWSDKLDLASRAQAAPVILDGMKDDEAAFDELRAASARPEARYPVVYDMENPWGILLPHLTRVKETCLRLQTRACAELAAGQNENALADVKLMLYLADTLKTEPFLISYLVRIACMQIAVEPIWEGLAEHGWTDVQLQQLQARLEPYNFLADMQWPMHAECAAGVLTVDLFKKKGLGMVADLTAMMSTTTGELIQNKLVLNWLGRIIPSGWYDLEKLNYCTLYEGQFHGTVDEAAKRVFPRQIAANTSALENQYASVGDEILSRGNLLDVIHHKFIAAMLLPALGRIPIKAATAQTSTDQAFIACALERYRLANGQFPDNLQALVPRFAAQLPNDVITGEPFKHHRTDDGRFVLYSVGWNETDDDGVPGKTMFDETEGDWVWEYPPSQ